MCVCRVNGSIIASWGEILDMNAHSFFVPHDDDDAHHHAPPSNGQGEALRPPSKPTSGFLQWIDRSIESTCANSSKRIPNSTPWVGGQCWARGSRDHPLSLVLLVLVGPPNTSHHSALRLFRPTRPLANADAEESRSSHDGPTDCLSRAPRPPKVYDAAAGGNRSIGERGVGNRGWTGQTTRPSCCWPLCPNQFVEGDHRRLRTDAAAAGIVCIL